MLDKKYLPWEEARRIILENVEEKAEVEEVNIEEAYGRVLAENIFAPEDLPGFIRSTVDGYAVRSSDTFGASESLPAYLRVVEEIPMGKPPEKALSSGECSAISTGGMLPEGADAVVMVENVNPVSEDLIEVLKPVSPGENIIEKDEDVKKGELVLEKGKVLKPQDIGALAGLGITKVKVAKKPVVAIILTGDEIIPADEKVTPGKVRDINSYTLAGLVLETGGIPLKLGIVRDDYQEIKKRVEEAYRKSDVILISGGTSAGTKDMTAEIINELGEPGVLLHGVAIKPGKPLVAGICNGKPVFGLPGHPVAVYLCFKLFVAPVIRKLTGVKKEPFKFKIKAELERNLFSQAGRTDFVRVSLHLKDRKLIAKPLLSKSGLIMSLVKADAILEIPSELLGIEKGKEVEVELI
jgi:molybdopterin molybdotransferase